MRILFVVAVSTLLAVASWVQADFLAVQFDFSDSPVYRINGTTGAGTLLGRSGVSRLGSGARNRSGTFFSVGGESNGILVTINPITGAATPVATLDPAPDPTASYRSLAFSPDGALFGIRQGAETPGPADFVRIDVNTGSVSVIASGMELMGIQGLDFSPDGIPYGWQFGGDRGLVTIDPLTGIVTDVNPSIGGSGIQGLGFAPDGTLYGTAGDSILKINTITGSPTFAGPGGYRDLRSLDFIIPEPASFLMLSIGGLGCSWRRQRQSGKGRTIDPYADSAMDQLTPRVPTTH